MKIFIGKDHNSRIMGIVLAQDEKTAGAYFTGADLYPNKIVIVDPDSSDHRLIPCVVLFRARKISYSENLEGEYIQV